MNTKTIVLIALVVALFSTACQNQPAAANSNPADQKSADTKPADSAEKKDDVPGEPQVSSAQPPTFSSSSAPDTAEAVKFPFEDFPAVGTAAKPGEYVLAPSYNWMQDALSKGLDQTTFIWYVQKMAAPSPETSEIQFLTERKKVPNAYLIHIPPGQKAKKGDIVLTWWQTGSGMNRAIVVDDKDPSSPIVRYLDIDYDNPAKSRDRSTTIGKMDEKIVPDSFVKLTKDFEPGTVVAVQDGANLRKGQLVRAAGDKVLVLEFAGRLKVYPRSQAKPVPIIPKVKAGDRVKAPWVGSFKDGVVTKVDAPIGRVFVRFDGQTEEKAIPFGDVLKN